MNLPKFKYHSDPIATGSIKSSNNVCECCGKDRGFISTGPAYSIEELRDCICPWCIYDGSAHDKFSVAFADIAGIGGYGRWEKVSKEIKETIAYRTPGFSGWQQEEWWTHCNDAADFLGPSGYEDLIEYGPEIESYFRNELGIEDEAVWNKYFLSLNKDYGPTAYVFRCIHCGKLGGYSDYH